MTETQIFMPRGRPKKVLPPEELVKKENKLRVKNFILRVLGHIDPRDLNWIINTAIVKSFFKRFPDQEFWDWFKVPDFLKECTDLKPLTGNWGKEFLRKEYNKFLDFKSQTIGIEPPELTFIENSADSQIIKTKKTLRDFLK